MGDGMVRRLGAGDRDVARVLFSMMAEVFEESHAPLGDAYLDGLLARPDFWALAAMADGEVVGGLTAHTLPMTRSETAEVLIYDLAVRADHQRQGIGRSLVTALREGAQISGVEEILVLVDNEDVGALRFYRRLGGVPSDVTLFVL